MNFVQSGTEALDDNLKLLQQVVVEYDKSDPGNFSTQYPKIEALKKKIAYEHLWPDITALIGTIQKGIKRTGLIVSGLQRFSRKGKGDIVEMEIAQIIDETLLLMQNELAKAQITVDREYRDALTIECRPVEMGQVFMNLLMNAVQAIKSKGKITIKTSLADERAQISIHDSGPGIPPEIASSIFDPFFTTKGVGKGTGLGLSITHGIIQAHGGTITVKSKMGEGAAFIITLPVHQEIQDGSNAPAAG